jgi:hypothetical protein
VKLARLRKPKATCCLSYVESRSNTNTKEKQVMLRGGHIREKERERERERESKRRNLRRQMELMYFLYKIEYGSFNHLKKETKVEREIYRV